MEYDLRLILTIISWFDDGCGQRGRRLVDENGQCRRAGERRDEARWQVLELNGRVSYLLDITAGLAGRLGQQGTPPVGHRAEQTRRSWPAGVLGAGGACRCA